MSDLEISVRVRADGSSLVGQLAPAEAAIDRLKGKAADASNETGQLVGVTGQVGQAARHSAVGIDTVTGALRQSGEAQRANTRDAQQNAGAVRQQGSAYGHLGTQVAQALQSIGIASAPLDLLTQRTGQAGTAMGGATARAAGFATMLATGLGTAAALAVDALASLVFNMFESAEASRQAEVGANALGQAQSVLGQMFDLTSGKIEHQNSLLVLNARLTAINLRAEAQQARQRANETFNDVRETSVGERLAAVFNPERTSTAGSRMANQDRATARFRGYVDSIRNARTPEARSDALDRALRETERGAPPGVSGTDWRQALIDFATAEQNDAVAGEIDRSLRDGALSPALRRDGNRRKRERSGRQDNRPEQASDALEHIQRIEEQFDDQPRAVDRAVQAMRQLDDVLEDASRRKLPRLDEMTQGADRARQAIRDGIVRQIVEPFREQPRLVGRAEEALRSLADTAEQLGGNNADFLRELRGAGDVVTAALNRPYRELLEDQLRTYETQRLIIRGREDEAAAVQIIHSLEEQLGPLSAERKRVIVASVGALREQARELEVIQERQRLFLGAAQDVRGELVNLAVDLPERRLRGILDLGEGVYSAFNRLRGEVLVENLFGGVFRQIEDFVTGRDRVRQANAEYSASIGTVRDALETLQTAQHDEISAVEGVVNAMRRLERSTDAAARRQDEAAAAPAAAAASAPAASTAAGRQVVRILNPLRSMFVGGDSHAEHLARGSHGVDLRASIGTSVFAPFDGRVSSSSSARGGLQVFLTSMDGRIRAGFAHLNGIIPAIGSTVAAGQLLARSGNSGVNPRTGRNVDPHLHSSLYIDGRRVDPMLFYGRRLALETRQLGQTATVAAQAIGEAQREVGEQTRATEQLSAASSTAAGQVGNLAGETADWFAALDRQLADDQARETGAGTTDGEDPDPIVVTMPPPVMQISPREFTRTLLTGLTSRIFGREVGEAVGRHLTSALEGAGTGRFASGLILGGRGSSLGSTIGGAAGQIAGRLAERAINASLASSGQRLIPGLAGPIGAAVFGVLGGLAGSVLRSSKTGSASITGVDGTAALSGNNKGQRAVASGLATNIQEALQQIAEQLGGGIGDFAVSIGVRDDKFRVDPSGRGATKTKKGAVDFGEDQAAALAFAIGDAVKDGAITGLSTAVQRALGSSPDINKALREALKVDELETMLSGVDGELAKSMRDFERQAAERRRIASQYGFDLVKLEEQTAKDRAKIFADVIASRVGDLQDLLNDLDFGELFAGSLADQRQRLLVEIAAAETDAKAGVEGAASKVASLRRKLLEVSEAAFGTAGGELAADRASSRSAAEEIIRIENDRVKAAQDAQLAANAKLDTNNSLTNETNNLLAEQLAVLRGMAASGGGGGTAGVNSGGSMRSVNIRDGLAQ